MLFANSLVIQICPRPPSTNSSIPVIKLLSSDARNKTAFATSSGLPIRPSGIVFKRVVFICSSSNKRLRTGVSVGPGLIALTRILRCLRSTVHERANDRIASLSCIVNTKRRGSFGSSDRSS